jgi:hypothetical protein
MVMHRWCRSGCVLVAATALALQTGAAPAVTQPRAPSSPPVDHVVLVDQTRDVWLIDVDGPTTPAGARPTVDITRAHAWHHDGEVGLLSRFVNLRRARHREVLETFIRTGLRR